MYLTEWYEKDGKIVGDTALDDFKRLTISIGSEIGPQSKLELIAFIMRKGYSNENYYTKQYPYARHDSADVMASGDKYVSVYGITPKRAPIENLAVNADMEKIDKYFDVET